MEKKIGKNAKLLMISDLFYSLTFVFSGTFLVAYFLNITSECIATISIYYILVFSLLGLGIVLLGKIIKNTNPIESHMHIQNFFQIMYKKYLKEKILED